MVLVQVGSAYTRRIILPDKRRVHQLRDELGRRAGRLVFPFYRLLRLCLRLFGHHSADYRGPDALERFVRAAGEEWPSARVVLVAPFRRSPGYRADEPIAARIEADMQALTALPGVSVFDANDVLGRCPDLRCVTGYNLNGRGCELAGTKLAAWIRESFAPAQTPTASDTGAYSLVSR